MSFLDLLENFSKSDEDIINILDKTCQYLNDPLRTIINDFVMDARIYGDMDGAFERLYVKLHSTRYVQFFKSILICYKYDSNYVDVIRDSKASVRAHLRSRTIRKAVVNSARVDLCALFIGGVIVCNMLDGFMSDSVIRILSSSFIGIGIMSYCLVIVGIAVYYLFWRYV